MQIRLGSRRPLLDTLATQDLSSYPWEIQNYMGRAKTTRAWALQATPRMTIAVVFAMWRETERLRPKTLENPLGERSIFAKCEELEWLFCGTKIRWQIYAVDDGCPEGSVSVATASIEGTRFERRVNILRLRDVVPGVSKPLMHLRDVDQSFKGGAIAYGCTRAAEDGADVVIYTDCDTSVSLADLGDAVDQVLQSDIDLCIGSRRHPESNLFVVNNDEYRGFRIYKAMQNALCPGLYNAPFVDTQFPLKVMRSDTVLLLHQSFDTYDFSFDVDYILQSISRKLKIRYMPSTYIHSYDASTVMTMGMGRVYGQLVSGIIRNAEKYEVPIHKGLSHALGEGDLARKMALMWKSNEESVPSGALDIDDPGKAGDMLAAWFIDL